MIEEPVPQLLVRLTLPLILGLLAMMSFGVVDAYFIAQLGPEQLAAISFVAPVQFMVVSAALGLGAGISSVIARAAGAGQTEEVNRLAGDGMLLGLGIYVFALLAGILSIGPLFSWLGASAGTQQLIRDYMLPFYLGSFTLIVSVVCGAILRAHGESKLYGTVTVAASILNMILDPLLIFGLFGFPRLELVGAALASIVARLIIILAGVPYMIKLGYLAAPSRRLSQVMHSWRQILHVALPAAVSQLIVPIAGAVVIGLVARYGEDAVAGIGVALRIEPLSVIVFYAFSAVAGPICGQNLGAQRFDRLQQAWRSIATYSLLIGLGIAALLALISPYLAMAFSDREEVINVTVTYLRIVPLSYGFYSLVMSGSAACNGIGRPLPDTLISFLRVLGVYLPVALVLQALFGLYGLFAAAALSNVLVGSSCYVWLMRQFHSKPSSEGSQS